MTGPTPPGQMGPDPTEAARLAAQRYAARRRARRWLVGGVVGAAVLVALALVIGLDDSDSPTRAGQAPAGPAPVAAGDSAGNLALSTSDAWVLVRWVARASGDLSALHLRIQGDGSTCRQSGKTGYGAGNGGGWLVTTHPVLGDGRPDTRRTLSRYEFRPCTGRRPVVDVREGIVRVPMRIPVEKGQELATIVRNTDPAPAENYTSTNFLYTDAGIAGANGRNERSPAAEDSYYGLDPRELVGYSDDGGRSWSLPGGQYGGPGNRSFLPAYIQEYADGRLAGQPYYYAPPPESGERTMVFPDVRASWTIRGLGAYTGSEGRGTLTLLVDGHVRARAGVEGQGMLRAAIRPVAVSPGQTVEVTSSGLSIRDVVADTAWGRLLGMHLPDRPFRLEGPNFSHAAPVYALPACPGCLDPVSP